MAALDTVIEDVVAPVLQLLAPVAVVLNTELPQLLITVIEGVAGTALGADVPEPAGVVPQALEAVTV